MHCIDHSSRWSLHCDPTKPPKVSSVTHTARIPSARSKIGRQEWTEASLHVSEKKVQPFERPHTPLFTLCRIAHRVSSRLFLEHALRQFQPRALQRISVMV